MFKIDHSFEKIVCVSKNGVFFFFGPVFFPLSENECVCVYGSIFSSEKKNTSICNFFENKNNDSKIVYNVLRVYIHFSY